MYSKVSHSALQYEQVSLPEVKINAADKKTATNQAPATPSATSVITSFLFTVCDMNIKKDTQTVLKNKIICIHHCLDVNVKQASRSSTKLWGICYLKKKGKKKWIGISIICIVLAVASTNMQAMKTKQTLDW